MLCQQCGKSILEKTVFCPQCGLRLEDEFAPNANPVPIIKAASANQHGSRTAIPQRGDIYAGRYQIERYLGMGSLCNSFLCRDTFANNQEVVLKIMHARKAAEPHFIEAFLFLANSVAEYQSSGIAKIYQSGQYEGSAYYTMEFVTGIPLRMWLLERLTFENRVLQGLALVRKLLKILEVVHERSCYGCLKPENIFVTPAGPVIMDFGVCGFLNPQEFEFNAYARRYLPYMAPELKQDWANLVPQSDSYSVGAILYEILAGRVPSGQIRLPSQLSSLFGIEADELILQALSNKPNDRFVSINAFSNALDTLQSNLFQARQKATLENPTHPINRNLNALKPILEEADNGLELTSDQQTLMDPRNTFTNTGFIAKPALSSGSLPVLGEATQHASIPDYLKEAPKNRPETSILGTQVARRTRVPSPALNELQHSESALQTMHFVAPIKVFSNTFDDIYLEEKVPIWLWPLVGGMGLGIIGGAVYLAKVFSF